MNIVDQPNVGNSTQSAPAARKLDSINAVDYRYLQDYVYRQSGIVLAEDKQYLMDARLGPILKKAGFQTVADLCSLLRRTTRKHCLQHFQDRAFILPIFVFPSARRAFPLAGALLFVRQTFRLGALNGFRRYQNPLAFVTIPRPRPTHHHCAQRRVFCRASRQRRIA